MKLNLNRWMKQARRLTGAADLRAATAAIQTAMRLASSFQAPAAPATPAGLKRARPGTSFRPDPVREAPDLRDVGEEPLAGEFIAGNHLDARGHRDYRLYIPPQAGAAPLPLVVMLHGCTQDAVDFAAGTGMNTAAQAQGFFVLYPEQAQQANPQRCWNWFKHSHQKRDRGEPALLAGMVRETIARHAIDPDRVYVAGLSAGGAMAAILANAYPEIFAAVGVHSGLAVGAAGDLASAMMAMRSGAAAMPGTVEASGSPMAFPMPAIVFHGDADTTVHPSNGAHVFDAARHGSDAATEAPLQVQRPGKRNATVHTLRSSSGRVTAEHWIVHGAPHAWSGGSAKGSYTDPKGPDASAEMLRFFFDHPRLHG